MSGDALALGRAPRGKRSVFWPNSRDFGDSISSREKHVATETEASRAHAAVLQA